MGEIELPVYQQSDTEEIEKRSVSETELQTTSQALLRWQRASYRIQKIRQMSIQTIPPTPVSCPQLGSVSLYS